MAQKMSTAMRRYMLRFIPAMLAYVVVLTGSILTFEHLRPTGPLLWVVAVAPALPIIAVIAIMGLYLMEEADEFQRVDGLAGDLQAICEIRLAPVALGAQHLEAVLHLYLQRTRGWASPKAPQNTGKAR